MRLIVPVLLLVLLSGCMGNLQQLALLAPEANDFKSALAAEYLAYADSESEQGHTLVSEYFANKGLDAYHGKPVQPEMVDAALTKPIQKRLQSSRDMLLALLTDDVKHVVPQPAARAHLLFDCWAREAGHNPKEADICAGEFASTVETLQSVAASFDQGGEAAHAILFAPGSTKLTAEALAKLQKITRSLKGGGAYTIEMNGSYGTTAGRKRLVQRQAELRKALVARGVVDGRIRAKDMRGERAVRLSSDRKGRDSSKVTLTVKVYGVQKAAPEAAGGQ